MANTTGYMGFKHLGFLPGYAPDYQLRAEVISNANATAIYRGDPVVHSSGVIVAAVTTGSQVYGIFDGCMYTDSSGNTKWSPYCPATQTATGYVLIAPGAMFLAQASNTAIVTSNSAGLPAHMRMSVVVMRHWKRDWQSRLCAGLPRKRGKEICSLTWIGCPV